MVAIPPILLVVVAIIAATVILMTRDKIISRLAFRNISRRKTTVLLVIAGLLIGTAMISGSLVTGDTMNSLFTRGAYFSYGAVDESVYYQNPALGYAYFNYSVYDEVRGQLLSIPNTIGVTPMIITSAALFDNRTKVGQSGVVLIGVYSNSTAVLGDFKAGDGTLIDPNIGESGAILNFMAAKDLNATVGDPVQIISEFKTETFTVKAIDQSFERSGFPGESDHVLITLTAAQTLLNKQGEINYIAITNTGGLHQGIIHTAQVTKQANSTLSTINIVGGNQLHAFGDKNASVTNAAQGAQFLATFFLTTSSFTIIAGVVLIINIFVMLAEERKKEMGMARAVGMKRYHLTKMFLFEGTQYALASSAVGVFVGIAIAYAILYFFGKIIIGFVQFLNIDIILQSFTFTPQTLVTSFSAGLLITYLTILLASWRVSKLNIIRAIRDIPEPPKGIRTYTWLSFLGILMIVSGIAANFEGKSLGNAVLFLIGPALSIFGFGLVLSRFVKNRYAFSIGSIALLIYWGYPPFSWNNPAVPAFGNGFAQFVLGGVFMVVSGVLLAIYNSDLIMKAITRILRIKPSWLPVFKIGLSYPANKKFRTGVTIFMFALVMFTVVFISVLISLNQENLNQAFQANSGGYDLIATTSFPVQDLQHKIRSDSNVSSSLSSVVAFNGGYLATRDLSQKNSSILYTLYVGANSSTIGEDNFFKTNTFNMTNATAEFLLPNGRVDAPKVWNDITGNPDHVVLSTSALAGGFRGGGPPSRETRQPGDVVSIALPNRTVTNITIIAIMNGVSLDGFVSTSQYVDQKLHTNASQFALLSLSNIQDADKIALDLKRDFLSYGLQVLVLPDLLNQILEAIQSFFTLFQGFLGLGLVVGIAGLSIIAVRAVVERRQEIGMVRALGFTKNMVLGSFLLENSFVALLGIIIGALLAIDLGYAFSTSSGTSLPYVIPYANIVEVTIVGYGFAMLGTVWSAFRAARTLPAEALRYIE